MPEFTIMTPKGMHGKTYVAADAEEAGRLAEADGENVLDIQDQWIIVPDDEADELYEPLFEVVGAMTYDPVTDNLQPLKAIILDSPEAVAALPPLPLLDGTGYVTGGPLGDCEMDGTNEHWDDGHEMYWHCDRPATRTVDGMPVCDEHAGEDLCPGCGRDVDHDEDECEGPKS